MKWVLVILVVLLAAFYFLCGIVVIQPIGAVPEGRTVVYFRAGTNLPFLTSPDGLLLDTGGDVSLLTRAVSAGAIAETLNGRIIARLPYSHTLYLWSTGGREFER